MTGHVPKASITTLIKEDERLVLRAFGRKPSMCIHELHAITRIPYPELTKVMKRLLHRDLIRKVSDLALGKDDLQYIKVGGSVEMESLQFIEERLSPLIGLSESQMRGRVLMIKNMKRKLIVDWHPMLDYLLGDYERDLKRMEALREGPDEPDALDRDIDDDGIKNVYLEK